MSKPDWQRSAFSSVSPEDVTGGRAMGSLAVPTQRSPARRQRQVQVQLLKGLDASQPR